VIRVFFVPFSLGLFEKSGYDLAADFISNVASSEKSVYSSRGMAETEDVQGRDVSEYVVWSRIGWVGKGRVF
jgi:hypothetical protein